MQLYYKTILNAKFKHKMYYNLRKQRDAATPLMKLKNKNS